jgi:hypothetical protein
MKTINELMVRLAIDICAADAPPVLAAVIGEVWLIDCVTLADLTADVEVEFSKNSCGEYMGVGVASELDKSIVEVA